MPAGRAPRARARSARKVGPWSHACVVASASLNALSLEGTYKTDTSATACTSMSSSLACCVAAPFDHGASFCMCLQRAREARPSPRWVQATPRLRPASGARFRTRCSVTAHLWRCAAIAATIGTAGLSPIASPAAPVRASLLSVVVVALLALFTRCLLTACRQGQAPDRLGSHLIVRRCVRWSAHSSAARLTPSFVLFAACAVGTFASSAAQSACAICAADQYADTTGRSACIAYAINMFGPWPLLHS